MIFKPKKDLLYGLILLPVGLFLIGFGASFPFIFDADLVSIFVITGLLIPFGIYFLWCWFGTSYWISENTLVVKQGPFSRSISIEKIETIERNTMPLVSSTALSLESYIIQYKPYKTFIIAPENIEEFVRILQEKHNHIKFTRN
ncbi:PH domain-containing protein [Alkalicoccobacillus murimartini]|uniref:Uncharacterized protein YyaB-like PH domain-containing protein n=1 Tax=Alkalicoccobacillus murimartini TaxID=171685 RepID=A0ABT9YI43_9BACI|nr:PH domain-containing protein [Alkalicoccobacillus murimartini]MDQ0207531.1 hypothetical protein [Alkalicoccobacillus murimartini]